MRRLIFIPVILVLALVAGCSEDEAILSHPITEAGITIGEWSWFEIDGMRCRDASTTGIGVRLGRDASKWAFYMQGGGACFTDETCEGNPSNFTLNDFSERVNNGFYDGGILDDSRSENPLADWNFVFIPYCTGDVHSGDKENGYGLGISEPQQFVGSRNVSALLEWMEPYMKEQGVDEIVVSGISAGGFGTHLTYYAVKERFPGIQTHLINDSGPLMSDEAVFPNCLRLGFQLIYNIPLPGGVIFCCTPTYGMADIYTFFSRQFPEDNFGLLSYLEDDIIRFFYAGGQNDCSGGAISGDLYRQGMQHLKENIMMPAPNFSTYYVEGDGHTFIQGDRFYETEVNGVTVYDFVREVMAGNSIHIE